MNYQEEYLKCLSDKTRRYFIENYLSTFNADEKREIPFKLFPRQIELLKSFVGYNNTIAIKHRQAGITTVASAWITGQCVFASKSSPETVLCIGNDLNISTQLIEKISTFLDQVPRWMWGSEFYSPDPDSSKNTKSIYKTRNKQRIELFNGCKIYARSSGEHAARGISAVSILVFDECAFIANGVSVYSSAVAATSSVKDAKILMISTPNGKDQLYYRTYSKALRGENNYHPVEFKWFQDLRYNKNLKWYRKNPDNGQVEWDYDTIIKKDGSIEYNEERWRKLEKDGWVPTSPWFEDMCKSFNNDDRKIAQELLVSFLGSSDNVIAPEVIEMHMKENVVELPPNWNLKDPFVKETWIWKDPIPGHRYVCACMPEGQKILTQRGLINVENVTLVDKLYDKDGNLTFINKLYQRDVEEEIITIKPYGICNDLSFTTEHPIWSSTNNKKERCYSKHNNTYAFNERYYSHDFKFNLCKELKVGDWLQIPNLYYKKNISEEVILTKWHYDKIQNPLLNEDFWWFCGLWLAEGCCVKDKRGNYRIYTSHNMNESEIMNKVKDCIINIFNRKPNSRQIKNTKAMNVFFNFNYLATFLCENFGKYAHGKYISEWVKYLPDNLKKNFVMGYLYGDGTFTKQKRDGLRISCGSVSLKLLNDLQDILFSMGILCSVQLSKKECDMKIQNRLIRAKDLFTLSIPKFDSYVLLDKCELKNMFIDERKLLHHKKTYMYFSKDNRFIFIKINKILNCPYKGKVYNFETECHNYYVNKICTHNCDPSSGSSEDFTAIEVFDCDALDDNGFPCYEQVLEYVGKRTGDEIGEMVAEYAGVYNNALVVVECIGGYGDATVLALQRLRYPNLYYEQPQLKTYTVEREYSKFNAKQGDLLPGFRNNGLRTQMIQNFVTLIKENAFKVRSSRVIAEMDTWVWKNGRPDHMDGMHDDTLTCLSMGTFVMLYYMLKNERTKEKDVSIIKSWRVNNSLNSNYNSMNLESTVEISTTTKLPFYSSQQIQQKEKSRFEAMLLMGGFRPR